jgi:CheY-like chemotaxis protein
LRRVVGENTKESSKRQLVTRHNLHKGENGIHLLLAEDEPINQMLAVAVLEENGYSVTLANSGRKVLEVFNPKVFQLVLMDIQMPEMDGFETTKAIREIERSTGSHVPIIAMTAHATGKDRERCLEVGMDGFISKPINVETLKKEIDEILAKLKP